MQMSAGFPLNALFAGKVRPGTIYPVDILCGVMVLSTAGMSKFGDTPPIGWASPARDVYKRQGLHAAARPAAQQDAEIQLRRGLRHRE